MGLKGPPVSGSENINYETVLLLPAMEAVVCMLAGDPIMGLMTELPWLVLPTVPPVAPWRDEGEPILSGSSFAVLDLPGIFSICIQA